MDNEQTQEEIIQDLESRISYLEELLEWFEHWEKVKIWINQLFDYTEQLNSRLLSIE